MSFARMAVHKTCPDRLGHQLIDKLLAEHKTPDDIIGDHGLLKQLTETVLERAMQADMTEHRGYEKHDPVAGQRWFVGNDETD